MLLALAIIVAVVGGIGLMGVLSISVVERTKEIGVLRAIGGAVAHDHGHVQARRRAARHAELGFCHSHFVGTDARGGGCVADRPIVH